MIDEGGKASLADRVRHFVYQQYIEPARGAGRMDVMVRTGDIHAGMRLVGRMPAICSALGRKFEAQYQIKLLDRQGPPQGANVFFRFGLDPGDVVRPLPETNIRVPVGCRESPTSARRSPSILNSASASTVFLVSCVAAKRASAAPAKDLYISDWFVKARHYVEQRGAAWFILSAEHGLVRPDQIVAPYERTLNTMPVHERRLWADRVIAQISEGAPQVTNVVFLAGARYREILANHLRDQGVRVEVPMQGMRIGEQLSWLGRA